MYPEEGISLGIHPANERRRYVCNDVSHWLNAYLDWSLLWPYIALDDLIFEGIGLTYFATMQKKNMWIFSVYLTISMLCICQTCLAHWHLQVAVYCSMSCKQKFTNKLLEYFFFVVYHCLWYWHTFPGTISGFMSRNDWSKFGLLMIGTLEGVTLEGGIYF